MDNYKSIDDLPVTLTATDMSKFLGISKCSCYAIFKRSDFPTIHIGDRFWSPVTVLLNGSKNRQGVLKSPKPRTPSVPFRLCRSL